MYIYIYVCVYICMYICICMYIYICITPTSHVRVERREAKGVLLLSRSLTRRVRRETARIIHAWRDATRGNSLLWVKDLWCKTIMNLLVLRQKFFR